MAELLRAKRGQILVETHLQDYNFHNGAYLITFNKAEAKFLVEALTQGLKQLDEDD